MFFEININNTILNVKLENKKHIKHCYLRVLKKDLIQIRANRYFTIYDAKDLIIRKKEWILENITRFEERENLANDEFMYLGKIENLNDYKIKNLDNFYKKEIEKYIFPFIKKYSNLMNLHPTKISFRKNKRTWGSCNYKNELSFNYLLMKYPLEIMEYIVVHELSHIEHKNHSKDFWALVEEFSPNYKKIERYFKTLLLYS